MPRQPILMLASQSPRRKELLGLIGYPFRTCPVEIDETFEPGRTPEENVVSIAVRKAQAAMALMAEPETTVLLSADTTVVLDNMPLGKPRDAADAFAMLSRLQGRSHQVLTGFAVTHGGRTVSGFARTVVTFEQIPDAEIRRYIDTMKPFDKAGSYGIQDPIMACYVRGIEGCYYNVVGLPVSKIFAALQPFLANRQGQQ